MDKICVELGPSVEFANALLQTRNVYRQMITYLNHVNETNDG